MYRKLSNNSPYHTLSNSLALLATSTTNLITPLRKQALLDGFVSFRNAYLKAIVCNKISTTMDNQMKNKLVKTIEAIEKVIPCKN